MPKKRTFTLRVGEVYASRGKGSDLVRIQRGTLGRMFYGDGSCALEFHLAAGTSLTDQEWDQLRRVLEALPNVKSTAPLDVNGVIGFHVYSTSHIRREKQLEDFVAMVNKMVAASLDAIVDY